MKISLIQPYIERGNIHKNAVIIQNLIDNSRGDLLVLPEYSFTGSLVLDSNADINQWMLECEAVKSKLTIPKGKVLLTNSIIQRSNCFYNCSEFIPLNLEQRKVYPDDTEKMHDITSGKYIETFHLFDKKFKVFICLDFKYWTLIPTEDIDFVFFIYHFTEQNLELRLKEMKEFVNQRKLPVLASSLVSDKNCGYSTYMKDDTVISISNVEGILEIEL